MNITGKCMVWTKDFKTNDGGNFRRYSAGIGKKLENGTYVNAYQPIRFKKGVVLENGTQIDIKNAFATVNSYKKDDKQINTVEWMVLDFDIVGGAEAEIQEQGFAQLVESDIPF